MDIKHQFFVIQHAMVIQMGFQFFFLETETGIFREIKATV